MEPRLAPNSVVILLATGTLQTGTNQIFDIPVDSSLNRLLIDATLSQDAVITINGPNGSIVKPSDAGVSVTQLRENYVMMVDKPSVGVWRATLQGNAPYRIRASGNGSSDRGLIDIYSFDLVEPNDDLHGGYLPLRRQPPAGSAVMGLITLMGSYQITEFDMLDENGKEIGKLPLTHDPLRMGPDDFLGNFIMPNSLFRVAVTGIDKKGAPNRRQLSPLVRVTDN